MSNDFENALHQGYSAADMAADMAEVEARTNELGCYCCRYGQEYHPTCNNIIAGCLGRCPYFKGV